MTNLIVLLREAQEIKGMLDEIGCKSRLLASSDRHDIEEYIRQMSRDVYKYSQRLDEIFEESHGIISKLG